ncbi:MAG: Ig-like domain-containing protein, partial [Pseudomonadota bacterium]
MHLLRPAVLVFSLIVAGLIASSSFSGPAGPAPIWLSDGSDVVRQLDPETHTVSRSLALPDGAGALAVDPYDHSLWVLTQEAQLLQFAAGGEPLRSTTLAPYLDDDDATYQQVLNPYGGNLWVGAGKTLLRLNPQGTPDVHTRLPDVIRQLVLGFDEILWVLTQQELFSLSPSGQILSRHAFAELGFAGNDKPASIAVDVLGKALWLATPRTLARVDTSPGTSLAAPVIVHTQSLPQPPFTSPLALNAFTGELWLATGDTLLAFDRQGAAIRSVNLAVHNLKKPRGLVFEPQTQTLWLHANGGRIAHVAGSGALLGALRVGNEDEDDDNGRARFGVMPAQLLPTAALHAPAPGSRIDHAQPPIELALGASCNSRPCDLGDDYLAAFTLNVTLDGAAIPFSAWMISSNTAVYTPGTLPEGTMDIAGTATDAFNHPSATFSGSFIIDLPPIITLTSPIDGTLTNQRDQTLLGFVNEPVQLTLNGAPLSAPPPTQQFTQTLTLNEGANTYQLVAIDSGNNRTEHTFTLRLDSTPPAAASAELGEIVEGQLGISGTAEAGSTVTITNLRTGVATRVVAGAAGTYSAQLAAQGGDMLRITVTDAAGNSSATTEAAIPGGLPPDPARVAPPVDRTVASILATTTAFLYTGSNPIQTGVAPNTIEPKRAAVLRGKVLARDTLNNSVPLSGVTISVHGHPEFGQTQSRADGLFDLAVNGGGYLTLDYSKTGFLPAQRQVHTPWQDFAHADDVVLIPLDSAVTTITANAPAMQVAQGNPVTDADGTRTATILFPAGTTATMTLPNGSTQTLATLSVRATEYTVGENGPKAMPGPLPPTSGYTYAVELSVDEAIAAGAKTVTFNQPVPVYVDNFLNFPVGGIVPVGYYDRDKTAWVPSDNGRVIKILAIQNHQAQLDTNGDGMADDAAQLTALGVTAAEQTQLANLYAPGQTLWRVTVTHFTPWDYNWPRKPPLDATSPQQPEAKADVPKDDPCEQDGSIIECQNQTLGERLSVTGTPFNLNYRSDRVPGRNHVLDIPLSDTSVPASLKRIELEIFVAGREFKQSVAAQPNQTYRFEWDGKDAYGRSLQGRQPVTARVGYVYAAVYATPSEFGIAFAAFGDAPMSGNRAREEIIFWQESTTALGGWDARDQGLGGWTLSRHHTYDPNGQVLRLGDGSRRSVRYVDAVIDTVAGNGAFWESSSGDGGPAMQALVTAPYGVAVAADGSFYIADPSFHRIRRVSPDGIISTVAGGLSRDDGNGDGGPARWAQMSNPYGVAVAADGSLYIADTGNQRIRRVDPDGIISTVAGNGTQGFGGDGGPATRAELNLPFSVAVAVDGSLYIGDTHNHRVRRVSPDGIISTVAGNGTQGFGGDGGPATQARMYYPYGIAVAVDGSLYIVDRHNHRIRRVDPEGTIRTVAGNGRAGFSGDGGPATQARMNSLFGVAAAADGSLYIADTANHRIRRVGSDGIISTVAGNGLNGFSSDGGPATQARINAPFGVALAADGSLYIADTYNNRIRKLSSALPSLTMNDLVVSSEDGTELFHFDPTGRHLQTLNTKTGATLYTFGYTNGLLSQITDGDGNITRIERSGNTPTAIVAPDGQRTVLALDANGFLATASNPAGEIHRMTYTADGLLTRFENPRGNASTMQYDADGLLTHDANAAGGFWRLVRSSTAKDSSVAMTSAEGRTTRYRIEELTTGDERRTNTAPDGTVSLSLRKTDGSTQNTSPDGTLTTSIEGPDPRWKMQAPLITSATTKTPGGLTSTTTTTRTVALAEANNPLSLTSETTSTTVNGRTFRTDYTASNRQYSFTSPQNRTTLLRTDIQGRPVFTQAPDINAVNYDYDTRGRLTTITQGSGTDLRSLAYTYGADGFVSRITDAQNRETLYQRDLAG